MYLLQFDYSTLHCLCLGSITTKGVTNFTLFFSWSRGSRLLCYRFSTVECVFACTAYHFWIQISIEGVRGASSLIVFDSPTCFLLLHQLIYYSILYYMCTYYYYVVVVVVLQTTPSYYYCEH